jgi:hypothetical protein
MLCYKSPVSLAPFSVLAKELLKDFIDVNIFAKAPFQRFQNSCDQIPVHQMTLGYLEGSASFMISIHI